MRAGADPGRCDEGAYSVCARRPQGSDWCGGDLRVAMGEAMFCGSRQEFEEAAGRYERLQSLGGACRMTATVAGEAGEP